MPLTEKRPNFGLFPEMQSRGCIKVEKKYSHSFHFLNGNRRFLEWTNKKLEEELDVFRSGLCQNLNSLEKSNVESFISLDNWLQVAKEISLNTKGNNARLFDKQRLWQIHRWKEHRENIEFANQIIQKAAKIDFILLVQTSSGLCSFHKNAFQKLAYALKSVNYEGNIWQ